MIYNILQHNILDDDVFGCTTSTMGCWLIQPSRCSINLSNSDKSKRDKNRRLWDCRDANAWIEFISMSVPIEHTFKDLLRAFKKSKELFKSMSFLCACHRTVRWNDFKSSISYQTGENHAFDAFPISQNASDKLPGFNKQTCIQSVLRASNAGQDGACGASSLNGL